MTDPWGSPFPRFGAGVGLARTVALGTRLGLDLAAFGPKSCVITGSNGKGSTAAMAAAILTEGIGGVGLFTSPHLTSVCERLQIDGQLIPRPVFEAHAHTVQAAARTFMADHPGEQVSAFEHLFLTAALWFQAEKVRLVVWEAGIGGRHDPTRLVRAKRTALVSLDLEHTAVLGGTLELIAMDKLDACAPGGVVVCGPDALDLADRLLVYARLTGVKLQFLRPDVDFRPGPNGSAALRLDGGTWVNVKVPLAGDHQIANAALAARLATAMLGERLVDGRGAEDGFSRAVVIGLKQARWPGRLETVAENPRVIVDVGHTPAATAAAVRGLDHLGVSHLVLLAGVSEGKNPLALLGPYLPNARALVVTEAPSRAQPAVAVAATLASHTSVEVMVEPQLEAAFAQAKALAQALDLPLMVAGGHFVAAAARALAHGQALSDIDPG